MYVEERMYTLHVGRAAEYFKNYEQCAAMQADPDWQAYLPRNRPLMVSQDTRIMKCAPFFVERLKKMLAAAK